MLQLPASHHISLETFIFIGAFCAFMLGVFAERLDRTKRRRPWRTKPHLSLVGPGYLSAHDSVDQLRLVMASDFKPTRLLSKSEARVFKFAEQALAEASLGWRVMAQVNLGEFLKTRDQRAFSSINSKRVDLLIISEDHLPIAAIEFQGLGHYRSDAAARDAVKKEALRRAGVRYIEIVAGDTPMDVRLAIEKLVSQTKYRSGASNS